MAISEEVRQVVAILEEEGFGALAGEVLTSISLGREVEKLRSGTEDDSGGDQETFITRVPIEAEEQLSEALEMVRLRLVETARALAEAGQIAGELTGGRARRIQFIDPVDEEATDSFSSQAIGVVGIADELEELLRRVPGMVVPPDTGEA